MKRVVGLMLVLACSASRAEASSGCGSHAAAAAMEAWRDKNAVALSSDLESRVCKEYLEGERWLLEKGGSTKEAIERAAGRAIGRYLDSIRVDPEIQSLKGRLSEAMGKTGFGYPDPNVFGSIHVETIPPDSEVSVDGGPWTLFKDFVVSIGSHTVRARKIGSGTCSRSVSVDPGQTAQAVCSLSL